MKQHCCELFADKMRDSSALGVTLSEGSVGGHPVVFLQMKSCNPINEEKIATAVRDGVLSLEGTIRLSSRQVIQFCPFCGKKIGG
jgi:hypothetical protein